MIATGGDKPSVEVRGPCVGLVCGLALASHVWAVNVPPSTQPPGALAPADTPQIVLLTFDDSVNTSAYESVRQVLADHVNPNGHPIKATFFVSVSYDYDFPSIRSLYDEGHEIAVHTMSHATGTNSSLVRWRQEIAGAKRTLSRLCGIPAEDIVGFRAPFLAPNDHVFRVLSERQFLYDASIIERVSGLSTSPSHLIWPYTLDGGLAQVASPSVAPQGPYPGLFEIPVWSQFSNTTAIITTDPSDAFTTAEVAAIWRTNFLARYQGNRAPYGIFLHASTSDQWLSKPDQSAERIAALKDFIEWALLHPDTWFITCRDLIEFMKAPVEASQAAVHPSFQTPERTPFPPSEIQRCSYPGHSTFRVCGACPPAPPTYTNAFFDFIPMAGGSVELNIVSQDAAYVWCELVVTNDTPNRMYNWEARFAVEGGTVQQLYDATPRQHGRQIVASARQYNSQLLAGGRRVITFRVKRNGKEVSIGEASVAAYGLGPKPVRIGLQRLHAPSRWQLSWDDNAYMYSVESTTRLEQPQQWTTVTNTLFQPELSVPHAGEEGTRFFRVKGVVY